MTPLRAFDLIVGPVLAVWLALLFWGETRHPLRRRAQSRRERLGANGAMMAIAFLTLRLVFIPAVFWVALWTTNAHVGLARWIPLPPLLAAVRAFLALDYTTYVWHRFNHRVGVLWRFHAVHHTDLDLDVSTAFRFHVGELLFSIVYRSAQIVGIGVSPVLLLAYEAVLDAATAFHHSNWRLPLGVERRLVRVVVTPRMHGVHHSTVERETNANWSSVLSCWDRLHATLRLDVAQDAVVIGLPAYRWPGELTVTTLLAMPFLRQRDLWTLPDGARPDRRPSADPVRLAGLA